VTIRVFNTSLSFLAEIDDFETLIVTRRFLGIETAEILIRRDANNAEHLVNHHILWLAGNKVFEILHRTITDQDKSMLRITAYGFGKTLTKRITVPPVGYAYDTASGSPDAVVKAYLDHHLIHPTDADRAVSFLANRVNQAGTAITDQSRYKNLQDEVVRVLTAVGRGYFFELDAGVIYFDTYTGRDLTASNTEGNPPAIFSTSYDNLLVQELMDSMADAQTQVYIAGQGEGESRTVVEVGTAAGMTRFETFHDARDTDDPGELANRGLSVIKAGIYTFEATVNPNANLAYETDFDVGDLVTIQAYGLSMDKRITEVRETYQAGRPFGLDITFGDRFPTLLTTINHQRILLDSVAAD
jgi:hypothetical protein